MLCLGIMEDMGVISCLDILIILGDYESAPPPKRRQHSTSLTIYQLFNKLGGPILIQFDLEGLTFYVIG